MFIIYASPIGSLDLRLTHCHQVAVALASSGHMVTLLTKGLPESLRGPSGLTLFRGDSIRDIQEDRSDAIHIVADQTWMPDISKLPHRLGIGKIIYDVTYSQHSSKGVCMGDEILTNAVDIKVPRASAYSVQFTIPASRNYYAHPNNQVLYYPGDERWLTNSQLDCLEELVHKVNEDLYFVSGIPPFYRNGIYVFPFLDSPDIPDSLVYDAIESGAFCIIISSRPPIFDTGYNIRWCKDTDDAIQEIKPILYRLRNSRVLCTRRESTPYLFHFPDVA